MSPDPPSNEIRRIIFVTSLRRLTARPTPYSFSRLIRTLVSPYKLLDEFASRNGGYLCPLEHNLPRALGRPVRTGPIVALQPLPKDISGCSLRNAAHRRPDCSTPSTLCPVISKRPTVFFYPPHDNLCGSVLADPACRTNDCPTPSTFCPTAGQLAISPLLHQIIDEIRGGALVYPTCDPTGRLFESKSDLSSLIKHVMGRCALAHHRAHERHKT
jgi:hypothetical protein